MPVETPSLFARVIQDHLELKRRNAELEPAMPIDGYRVEDPFDNHPLFKTEEQARLEETMDGDEPAVQIEAAALAWPGERHRRGRSDLRRGARRGHRPLVEVARLRLGRLGPQATTAAIPVSRLRRAARGFTPRCPPAPAAEAFTRAGDRRAGRAGDRNERHFSQEETTCCGRSF